MIGRVAPGSGLQKFLLRYLQTEKNLKPIAQRTCNICGYHGWFGHTGRPPRLDARCPGCLSLERHRLLKLAIDGGQIPIDVSGNDKVLHFAPEPILERMFRQIWPNYTTADLFRKADLTLNMEAIDLPDASMKLVIASHVLEHVDDRKAGKELYRILVPGGVLICMVPIVEGWKTTYENPDITSEDDRWLHFGQGDHVRYFGRDFRQRIERSGLKLIMEITAEGGDVIRYGLLRGEKVFVFAKPL
ncbi:methyltransferase domain-containing protein [Aestuariivirga sp.]|uniref:methyltransferase domain-containing protein n=1 Tax=Aestuariivirga sp. TaxID=2650926 RepID=UPI0037841CB8